MTISTDKSAPCRTGRRRFVTHKAESAANADVHAAGAELGAKHVIAQLPDPDRARKIDRVLAETYPEARCELDFDNPFELLVVTVLSAQTTDKRVNAVRPRLFAAYPDARAMASADRAHLEEIVGPLGFFRAKTDALLKLSQALVERYDGEVPRRLADLVTLPGVGRKTANVVLGNAFGVPGLTVDTHFARLARRFGWTGPRAGAVEDLWKRA